MPVACNGSPKHPLFCQTWLQSWEFPQQPTPAPGSIICWNSLQNSGKYLLTFTGLL